MTTSAGAFSAIDGDEPLTVSGIAAAWPVTFDLRVTGEDHARGPGVQQAHLVCAAGACGQSVFCLSADVSAGAYVTGPARYLYAVARHVREVHCDGGGALQK